MKKRHLTLIEVLIFCALSSLILGSLFYFFAQTVIVEKQIEKAKQELFYKSQLQIRLQDIFYQLLDNNNLSSHLQKSTLYSVNGKEHQSPTLYFHYGVELDMEPEFSGPIFGSLYVEDHKLILKTWPSKDVDDKQTIPVRKKILLQNVESVSYQFIYRDEKIPKKILTKDSWPLEEKKEKQKFPLMFTMTIKKSNASRANKEENKLSFAFFLSSKENAIIYEDN